MKGDGASRGLVVGVLQRHGGGEEVLECDKLDGNDEKAMGGEWEESEVQLRPAWVGVRRWRRVAKSVFDEEEESTTERDRELKGNKEGARGF